jgi:hypothetical protein
MNKQNFDLGWEYTEATGFLISGFRPVAAG